MKRKVLVLLLAVVLLTGCFSSKKTLESILKEKGYECGKNYCSLSTKEDVYTAVKLFDKEDSTYKKDLYYNKNANKNTELVYNWSTGDVTYNLEIANIKFTSSLNTKDEESFKCESEDDDEIFVETECLVIKSEIKEEVKKVDEVLSQVEE